MNAFRHPPQAAAPADDDANAAPLWAEWIVPPTQASNQPADDCCDAAADESALEECCF